MDTLNRFDCLNEIYYKYSQRYQFVEMAALGFLGFLIPFIFGHPQILIGIFVNALIIRSALSLQSYKTLPIIFTPSLGALARGMIFGPYSVFLIYMIPFIWIGNLILIYAFKMKIKNKHNYFAVLAAGSIAKAGFLYAVAFTMYSVSIIPAIFLSAMGIMQLITAVFGGIVVYLELRAERYFSD